MTKEEIKYYQRLSDGYDQEIAEGVVFTEAKFPTENNMKTENIQTTDSQVPAAEKGSIKEIIKESPNIIIASIPKHNQTKTAISTSLSVLKRIELHENKKKQAPSEGLYTIEESLAKYSANISEQEIKAWVYYQMLFGNPMRGWEKYYMKTSSKKENLIYSKESVNLKNQMFQDVKLVPSDTLIGRKTRFKNEYSGTTYIVIKTEDNELYYVPSDKTVEKEFAFSVLESELHELVKSKAICYSDGDYVPIPLYTYGNIYDIQDRLMGTFNAELNEYSGGYYKEIAAKFGIEIADWQKGLIETAIKEKGEFLFNDLTPSNRPSISKESDLSAIFKIRELNPESGIDFEKNFEENKSRRNRYDKYDSETEYTLFQAYALWFKANITDTMIEGTTKENIIDYYFHSRNIPDKDMTDKEKDEIRLSARLIGEKYYSQFLAEALTYVDMLKLNRLFNRTFNSFSKLDTDRIPVAFEVNKRIFNSDFSLNGAQRNGIAFMSANNSGCLAYQVGFGKTLTAIHNLASLLKQGKVKRPLILVPKQVYNNWIREMFGFWTDGNEKKFEKFAEAQFVNGALTGTNYKLNSWFNLGKSTLDDKKNVADIMKGHADKNKLVDVDTITIMTFEGMYKMGFSQKLYEELFAGIYSILENGKTTATDREKTKSEEKVKQYLGIGVSETVIDIDTCGFDYLVLDEAHAFKNVFNNVPLDKEQKNVWRLGGKSEPTKRAVKAFFHCLYVQKKYNGNVNLLTATPFTNSPLEIFSMLSLVGYESLKKYNLQNLYGFLTMFIETQVEYNVNHLNEIVLNTIIKSFRNKNLLRDVLYKHFDYQDNPAIAGVKRPCKINFPNNTVSTYLTMSDLQIEAQAIVREEAASYDPKTNRGAMGRALNWAKNNALSPYLVPGVEMYDSVDELMIESPKIQFSVECIKSIRDWSNKNDQDMSGQVIYANRGVALFPDIKKLLEQHCGFKRKIKFGDSLVDEVEIITGGGTDADIDRKETIKDAFNEGYVKVIIGTATIKEGVNLQKRGTNLFNLDLDWNPSDFQQLEGRIHRMGNMYKFVRIIVPLVQNTLDSFINQKLDEKGKRISSIWDKNNKSNNLEEYNAVDPMEIKFALIDDLNELYKMKVDTDKRKASRNFTIAEEKFLSIAKIEDVIETFNENFNEAEPKIHESLKNHKSFIRYLNKYITANKGMLKTERDRIGEVMIKTKENVDLLEKFFADRDFKALFEVLNNLRRKSYATQDAQGNRIDFATLSQKYASGSGYEDLLEISDYAIKDIMHPYGEMKKMERMVLTPYGFTVNDDFSQIREKLEDDKNAYQAELEFMDTEKYQKTILHDLKVELDRRKAERGDLSERVEQFASYNYLLGYPFDEDTSDKCSVPTSANPENNFPSQIGRTDFGNSEQFNEVEDLQELKKVELVKKLTRIKSFIPKMQYLIVRKSVLEFEDVIERLHAIIIKMPVNYQQDGLGNSGYVFLHYFYGGSDWYITEKDMSKESETVQAFGYMILNDDKQNAEWGYISIDEITSTNKVELDFHFSPRPLYEILEEDASTLDAEHQPKLDKVIAIINALKSKPIARKVTEQEESDQAEQQEITEAIEMLTQMLPELKGKEKKECKQAIEMLTEMIAAHEMVSGGKLKKVVRQYEPSEHLTKEQWEKWNDWVTTGKINGKKENNTIRVAKHVGVSSAAINAYTIDQNAKDNAMSTGGKVNEETGDQVTLLKGEGYWDLTKYPYGGDFKRFKGGEKGVMIKGTRKMGDEIRLKLEDGRIVMARVGAIDLPTHDEKRELALKNSHLFTMV